MSDYPHRIVCLTEETTELFYLLGEQDRIVGITAYTERPPEAKRDKPVVTAFISGSIPKIQALKPDLVIGFSDIQGDFAAELIKAGLNVLIMNQRSLDETLNAMLLLGRLVGRESETRALVNDWCGKLETIRAETAGRPRPRIFFQEWDEPLITGIRWVSELIEIAGGEDCFAELRENPMAKDRITDVETVAARAPDAIIGSWCGKPVDYDWVREKWKDTKAVRENRLYEIPSEIILQPGPALFLDGIDALKKYIDLARGENTNGTKK